MRSPDDILLYVKRKIYSQVCQLVPAELYPLSCDATGEINRDIAFISDDSPRFHNMTMEKMAFLIISTLNNKWAES